MRSKFLVLICLFILSIVLLSIFILFCVRTYRRMQQIRKELSRAQSLLQLVIERESLKEVRPFIVLLSA